MILDRAGRALVRVPPGESRSWHDARIVHRGDPPPAVEGAPESDPRFVKNWTIPGRAAGRAFVINGFLGWVPPDESEEKGVPVLPFVGGALLLVAFAAAAAYLIDRSRS